MPLAGRRADRSARQGPKALSQNEEFNTAQEFGGRVAKAGNSRMAEHHAH